LFRLQVGAFEVRDSADRASQRIRDAGFEVEQEHAGAIFRVLVTGISASDVHAASVKLGALGFGQIWVRE
jgi:cell division protein FtsN